MERDRAAGPDGGSGPPLLPAPYALTSVLNPP